jgi:hypothetical protein
MKGLTSANWIIEQIGAFARAAGEPFSAEELFMLKQPVGYFNESNRADFLKVNEKTVRMIRNTIIEEKLSGVECVEARAGLFIPPQWRRNYLDVYDSNLPWLLSHCAQSAMLHDPILGETKDWESPKVLSGFREPVSKNDEQDKNKVVPSNIEFELLLTSVRAFLAASNWLLAARKMLSLSLQREQPDEESNQLRTRIELLNIINSIGDLDDDVTSSWSLFVLDEQIHQLEKADRNLLRENSRYGTSAVLSKSHLQSRGLLEFDFCKKPSTYFMDVVAPFDFMCKTVGLEAIFAKLYAYQTVQLAVAVAQSSVFSGDKEKSMNEVHAFSSVLAEQVRVLDSYEPSTGSFEELHRDLLVITPRKSGVVDLLTILNFGPELEGPIMDDWRERFSSITLSFLAESEDESYEDDLGTDDEVFAEDQFEGDENIRNAAARLSEVEDLYRKGLLSEEEFNEKRKQIIDQI